MEGKAIHSLLSHWLRSYSSQIDPALIQTLTKRYNFLKYIPHFLRFPIEKIWNYLYQVPVLIQWEKANIQAELPTVKEKIPIKQCFDRIHTISSPITIHHLQEIMKLNGIRKVYFDRKVYTCLKIATPVIHAPPMWATENQGEGVTIAILDTGIAPHPDLDSRIIAFVDFINGYQTPYDDNGHGTHCAGCAASSGKSSNGMYKGVAPKAKLVGVKVLGKYGESNLSKVIQGIDWCIRNKEKYNIRIISLSLGSDSQLSYLEDPLCMITETAWKDGIVVVAAAGNNGPQPYTITCPGNHPTIITVGATDDRRTIHPQDDQVAVFSSRGPTLDSLVKPDLLAPGTNIVSLRSQASFLDTWLAQNQMDNHYFRLSGTSMSTPIVSGVVALMLTKNPHLTPNEVKQILLRSAITLNLPETVQGKGLVNAQKALGLVTRS